MRIPKWRKNTTSDCNQIFLNKNDQQVLIVSCAPGAKSVIYSCFVWLLQVPLSRADVPTMLDEESTQQSRHLGWPGQRRHFTCAASALPLPTITWSRSGGLFVVDSDTYRVNTSTRHLTVISTLEVGHLPSFSSQLFMLPPTPLELGQRWAMLWSVPLSVSRC